MADGRSDKGVTWEELFFDLAFVFAVTQFSILLHNDNSWAGVGRTLIVFVSMYWLWVGTTIYTNLRDISNTRDRLGIFALGLGNFVLALTIPGAYGDRGLLFACVYVITRGLLAFLSVRNVSVWRSFLFGPFGVGAIVAAPLLLIGGLMDGMIRTVLWAAAALFDVSTAWILRGRLAQVRLTPLHYTHRYGLLLILVLGESVIAVGAVAATEPLTPVRLTTIGLSYVLACALWWTYFVYGLADFRRAMARAERQAELRRSVLAYGHLLFSFGIVAVAVGLSEAVAEPLEHLRKNQVALLFAGSALFLSTFAYTHWRIKREIAWRRVAAGVSCLILMPAATHIPAVSALTLLVLVVITVSLSEQLIIRRQQPSGEDQQHGHHHVSGTSADEPDSNADNVDAGPPVHREDS